MKIANIETPTKKALLDAANGLMLEKGFVATSVDEICRAAKVTKGSFFHYFKSKEELGKELVVRFSKAASDFMKAACKDAGEDPLDRIYAFIDVVIMKSESPEAKGCLVGTFSQELSETHPEIRCLCAKSLERMAETFKEHLAQAKAKYAPKASFDVKSLADCFIALAQGSMLMMKAHQDKAIMKKNLFHFKEYLKHLFGR